MKVIITFETDGTNMDDDIEGTVLDLLGERLTQEQLDTVNVSILYP